MIEKTIHLAAMLKRTQFSSFFAEAAELFSQETKVSRLQTHKTRSCAHTERSTAEAGTQTEAWNRGGKGATVGSLSRVKTLADFEAVAGLSWDASVFTNVEVKVGNPLDTPHDTVKCVLVEPQDPRMDASIQRLYRDRFPDIAGIADKVAVVEQFTRRKGTGGVTMETTQKIVKLHHDGSEKSIWDVLQTLRGETSKDKAVAIHHVEALSVDRLKRLTQAVFHGVEAKVEIFTTAARKSDAAAPRVVKARSTLALSVEVGKRTFKDVLRGVREAVGGRPGCESIQSLRSTKEDKLLIVMGKDEAARDRVLKLLEEKNLKVSQVGPRVRKQVVHLRGLDDLATKEEVQLAIEQAVGADQTTMVGPLRPSRLNTQAVTVTLEATKADQLTKTGRLRVGPACCQVQNRLEVRGCLKCWGYDHAASDCKGPDRSKLCRRCGKEGHIRRDCKDTQTSCVLCKEEHSMGSNRCKAFRTALGRARKHQSSGHRWAPSGKRREKDPSPSPA